MCIYMYTMCESCRSEEGVRSLEMEIQMIMIHQVGTRNQTQVPWTSSRCS